MRGFAGHGGGAEVCGRVYEDPGDFVVAGEERDVQRRLAVRVGRVNKGLPCQQRTDDLNVAVFAGEMQWRYVAGRVRSDRERLGVNQPAQRSQRPGSRGLVQQGSAHGLCHVNKRAATRVQHP